MPPLKRVGIIDEPDDQQISAPFFILACLVLDWPMDRFGLKQLLTPKTLPQQIQRFIRLLFTVLSKVHLVLCHLLMG